MNAIFAFKLAYAFNMFVSVDAAVYGTNVAIEPVPFSTMLVTISINEPIVFASVEVAAVPAVGAEPILIFAVVFSTNVGITDVPFSMISKIVSKEDVTKPAFEDASVPVVYCVPPVTFTKPLALLTKPTIEPVPFSITSNTISNEDVVLLIKEVGIVLPVVGEYDVTFVVPLALVTTVGITLNPFSTISNTISKELLNKFLSVWSTLIEDVIWVPAIAVTPLSVDDIIVGIAETPLSIILITLPNDDDTIDLSVLLTEILFKYCSSVVALIPAKVFKTKFG